MSQLPCSYGRKQATALAVMNLRAVLAPFELHYLARPLPASADDASPPGVGTASARFQPRDEAGRFVTYDALRAAIGFSYFLTDSEYEPQGSGIDHDVEDPSGVDHVLEEWLWD